MHALRRTVIMGTIVLALSGLGTRGATARSQITPTAPTCQATQLSIAQAAISGATGHLAVALRLHNASARSCTLKGYATIVLLDAARRPLLTVLQWGTGGFFMPFNRPVRLVTLAPGGNAYMAMGWTHIPQPGQTCPLAPYLLFLPPGAASALLVAVGQGSVPAYGPVDACGGQLTVSAVEPTPFVL